MKHKFEELFIVENNGILTLRKIIISQTYEVGELLNEEDAKFALLNRDQFFFGMNQNGFFVINGVHLS